MALLFVDSFDHYASGDIAEKWTSNIYATIDTGTGRNSTDSMRLYNPTQNVSCWVTLGTIQTWIVGFGFQPGVLDTNIMVALRDNATNQIALQLNADGTVTIFRGATALETSSDAVSINTWYYMELKVKIDNSVGTYELHMNEQTWLQASGVDTQQTANAYATNLCFSWPKVTAGFRIDDLYVCDDSGAANNDFLGDIRVVAHLPNAAGNYAQWTPSAGDNYQNVDDNPPDGDTTYNSSGTADQRDSFALSDLPAGVIGACKGIQVLLNSRKDDAGIRTVAPFLRISATDYDGDAASVGDTYAFWVRQVWENNPNTASPFSVAEVNALEAGYKLVS